MRDHAAIPEGLRVGDPEEVWVVMERRIVHTGWQLTEHAHLPGVPDGCS